VRLSRSPRTGPDRTLIWRVGAFFLGAGLWFAGVVYGVEWMTFVAILVIAAGIGLRFFTRSPADGHSADGDPDFDDEGGADSPHADPEHDSR
jgi:fatty acid desaturase